MSDCYGGKLHPCIELEIRPVKLPVITLTTAEGTQMREILQTGCEKATKGTSRLRF